MAGINTNPLSLAQAVSSLIERKPAANANENNGKAFNFALNQKTDTGVDNVMADAEVINANAGNEDALRGEEIKAIPKDILLKALKEAGIEQNEATLAVVKALVRENLPLTEKNITALMLNSHLFKDAPLETLAAMMRLEMPITNETAKQFENMVKSGDNIADKINNLLDRLPMQIINGSKNLSELSTAFSKLSSFAKFADSVVQTQTPTPTQSHSQNQTQMQAQSQSQLQSQTQSNHVAPSRGGRTAAANINAASLGESLNSLMNAISEKDALLSAAAGRITAQPKSLATNNKPLLNISEMRELADALIEIKAPMSLINRIAELNRESIRAAAEVSPNAPVKSPVQSAAEEILSIVDRFIQEINARTQDETVLRQDVRENQNQGKDTSNLRYRTQKTVVEDIGGRKELFEGIKNLLENKPFHKIVKSLIEERWLLKPQNMNIEDVENFLSKLNDNLSKFEYQFRDTNLQDMRADAKDIRENANLLHDLNKSLPFLQIPIKLSNQIINSELYVLTRVKKDGRGGKGEAASENLKVLLKLKLQNLGNLDIYVNMDGKLIRSKFFSEQDDALSMIKEYLPELGVSISKLGFVFRSSVSKTEKGFDFVGDFLNRELPRIEFKRQALHMNI